jgi:hypothetical protein
MASSLFRKYHVAVVDSDPSYVKKVLQALKDLYSNKVVVQTYTEHSKMFLDINLAAANRRPFDLAIMKSEEKPTSMVLKRTNPSVKIVMCDNVQSLEQDTAKLFV